ncbi:CD48 antigen-like isoform X1 [Larimichthys crocea]|uniref:CD48 antigen-like isoform X1 n=1 Tax=Larimichthys crocea TaxID=215358 RepID=UPI000F5E2211|nr:CD48 antigen-like isoform X1 [Larimichthys crocea]
MERILLVCTLVVCLLQGSSAVTPVFVKKGDDLLLNVTEDVPEDFSIVAWKFREKIVVTFFNQGKPTVSGAYTGRVETSMKNFSVKLKNLQEADSGVYTAQVIAEVQQTLEYNVTVQAPVSPVGLTVDSVSNSSDSCNLTVTCSTQDSHISSTLRCDTQTCSQEGGERSEVTTSGASLHVYLVNGSIICNHSNQVSWTTNMTNIQDFCPQHVGFKPSRNHVITYVTATVGVLAVILSITAGVFKFRQRGTDERENTENTIYAVPEAVQQGDHSPHEVVYSDLESCCLQMSLLVLLALVQMCFGLDEPDGMTVYPDLMLPMCLFVFYSSFSKASFHYKRCNFNY